ncbi:NAD(P)H-hydrate dehydratase [Ktedonospora formicarum]|uniref:Bifunctional NAD(P)H-hydrate repair enzyme n=1 Tax=Ktedonospora formicarum TaxID=2778364 RepID=A0A8J3MQ48_9CHLR|nr:NAD(P)H-hydrate dehydratase [Ktedonospora formicarum]GHO43600.1 bifunctional ADP-dependent (S)-NAD(P)H-hydrate dehydratase/NAD(P)H-hydrate epimerase [Ktedonospora formicarum]
MHIVTVAEMRELEAQAEHQYGLTSPILMRHAGQSAADIFMAQLLPHHSINDLEVLFLIGPGNNGGDGMIMADNLARAGALVSLYTWKTHELTIRGQPIAEQQIDKELTSGLQSADYVIDALLGTGTSRPLNEDMRALLARVEGERKQRPDLRVVAIDQPTGVHTDSGEVDPGTLRADMTITLACPKIGFFFFPARDFIGELHVGSIALPPTLEHNLSTEMLNTGLCRASLPKRPLNSNKGTFGKVMLFCGSQPYPGSAYLAGSSAARAGAGLITLAVTEKMLPTYASSFHEATFAILPEEPKSEISRGQAHDRAQALTEHLPGYRALLMGPGLGQSPETRETILQVLEDLRNQPPNKRPRLIIDADGLNNLSALEHWWTLLPEGTVITPHPGEMGRLCDSLKVSGGSIDRLQLAREKAREWNVILVLKGACTLVVSPLGETRINWKANPALATAGTGDVLAGMIAGFLAQGLIPFDAASLGVYLHSCAAERVSSELGDAGLLASDLLPQIPRVMRDILHTSFEEGSDITER